MAVAIRAVRGAALIALPLALACSTDVLLGARTHDRDAGSDRDGRVPADGSTGDADDAGARPGVGVAVLEQEPQDCSAQELAGSSFCDPQTWGGTAPGAARDLVITAGQTIVVDCEAQARTLTIDPGGVLRASHARASRLTVHGNLVVRGRLEYGRTGCRIPADVSAELVFAGMRDGQYQGTPSAGETSDDTPVDTPMMPLDSDVGLWVVDQGAFTGAGALKRAWSFLHDGAGPLDASFTVEDASGWRAGDRVVLTPTAQRSERDHVEQFDEGAIAAIDGNVIALEPAPAFAHAGCRDCLRRGEALNLSRNVVVRSEDDGGHAHVMVAQRGVLQLDSIELRWLGPEWPEDGGRCGGPARRAPIYFHQQDAAAGESYLRHLAIWGGQNHFVVVERSHGLELRDLAGYDALGSGFELFFDAAGCARCTREHAPRVPMREVLAAKVGVPLREADCLRIVHRHTGIAVAGGEGSGCERCVATGIGYLGSGADVAGFSWQEGGTGRPLQFRFDHNVAHNNRNHGAFIWHNETSPQPPYTGNAFWSNDGHGLAWGALGSAYVLRELSALDNGDASVGFGVVPEDDRARIDGALLDDFSVTGAAFVPEHPTVLRALSFSGTRPVAFTQAHAACTDGDETDPDDPDCVRVWLRIEDPRFAPGVKPFDFGVTGNATSLWEVRGFTHPDAEYEDLPRDFDLYRRDQQVPGGALHPGFDAWLVRR